MPKKKSPSYDPADMINTPPAPEGLTDRLVEGRTPVLEFIAGLIEKAIQSKAHGVCRIALDSHLGVPWERWTKELREILKSRGVSPEFLDSKDYFRDAESLEKMIRPHLPEDPVFGKVFKGRLLDFLDKRKLAKIEKRVRTFVLDAELHPGANALVCFGEGATRIAPNHCFDYILYVDLCREEILKRLKSGLVRPLGSKAARPKRNQPKESGLPAYFSTRRLYYIDYPVLEKHRAWILRRLDFYIDGNEPENPKLLSSESFSRLLDQVTSSPIKPKPFYDPGPWGGQWLKEVRKLPNEMINCAWSYDLIEPEASFLVKWGKSILEFPFQILTARHSRAILGSKGRKPIFAGQFPIRVNYDDSYQGGDMALQCHPNNNYVKKHFNEPYRQDESYYIVDTAPGSRVYLGLREEACLEDFRRAVLRAEKEGVPFDHNAYVNSIPSKAGDLFLIPAGTLHGSGKNETVLEISATTYRYTFHFYDYLRPGLDGKLRPIHSGHAFAALKSGRRTRWVRSNLVQKPRRLRGGRGWSEYLIGSLPELFFKVHRLEFEKEIRDDTEGEFHLLVLVEGTRIRVESLGNRTNGAELPFSCVILIPATFGTYRIASTDGAPCKVVKVLMS